MYNKLNVALFISGFVYNSLFKKNTIKLCAIYTFYKEIIDMNGMRLLKR